MDSLFGGDGDDTFIYNQDAAWSIDYTLASLGSEAPFAQYVNLGEKNRSYDSFHGDIDEGFLVNGTGIDTLIMTSGNDVLVAGDTLSPMYNYFTPRVAYIDIIEAGDGDDVVDMTGANSVAVTINGGKGDDALAGTTTADTIDGGEDNDLIYGGRGNDILKGGSGDDTFYFDIDDGSDTISDASGDDKIIFGDGITYAALTLTRSGSDLSIQVGSDTITIRDHFSTAHDGRIEVLEFSDESTFDLGSYGIDPTANDDAGQGNEDEIITGNVLSNDVAGIGDILVAVSQDFTTAKGGKVILNANGAYSYQGAANFNGTDSFSYTISDNNGGTASATVSLTILSVNDSPVAVDDVFSVYRNGQVTGSVLSNDTDIDGGTLTVQPGSYVTSLGGSMVLSVNGSFTYLPPKGFFGGQDSFDYTALDGQGGSDAGTVTFNVVLPSGAIVGTSAGNKLKGTSKGDLILGLAGNDRIDAGKGDDIVVGGTGKDTIKGGKGADMFVFESAGDSAVKPKLSDLIADFKRGQGDRIDLSAIDPLNASRVFAFIGKKKFSGEAGELRWQKMGSNTLVSGDINGDGIADIAIMVAKAGAMKAADFIL